MYILATLQDVVLAVEAEAKIDELPSAPQEMHTVPMPVNGRVLHAIAVYTK